MRRQSGEARLRTRAENERGVVGLRVGQRAPLPARQRGQRASSARKRRRAKRSGADHGIARSPAAGP
eukprot:2307696-Pyramimonas_sp.AAC.1